MQFSIIDTNLRRRITLSFFLALFVLIVGPQPLPASAPDEGKTEGMRSEESELHLRIELDGAVKVSTLKPGDVVEGKLSRDVYRGDWRLFPAGSRVRMTVDKLGRRRRIPNDHWPSVVRFFTPRHEHFPTFRSVGVFFPDGTEKLLPVSFLSIRNEVSIHMQLKAKAETVPQPVGGAATQGGELDAAPSIPMPPRSKGSKEKLRVILTLEVTEPTDGQLKTLRAEEAPAPRPATGPVILAAGTQAQIILLDTLNASKSRPGDAFRARLIEPVRLDSNIVLPEGTLIEGKVVKRTPPRMLSRAATLQLAFTRLIVPGRVGVSVVASLTGAELDWRSHTRIDPEGELRGDHPGKAWMLINLGVTGGTAKEADDLTQLIIEAIVSSVTDASTAGVARIAGSCASGLFFLTRHGRDIVIPEFTEMTIMFDRPVSLSAYK